MLGKFMNYCKNNKKNIIISVIIIVVLVALCVKAIEYNTSVDKQWSSYALTDTTVGGIFDITEIAQTFTYEKETLSGISLQFGTFGRVNNGTVTVELYKDPMGTNELIFTETFLASSLHDTMFRDFFFDEITDAKGKFFILKVTADETMDLPVTLWRADSDVIPGGSCYIDGQDTGADLNYKFFKSNDFGFNEILIILFFIFTIFAVIFMAAKKMFIFADTYKPKYVRVFTLSVFYIVLMSVVKTDVIDGTRTYGVSIVSVCILAVIAALTVLFERKLLLYSSILNYCKNERQRYRELINTIKTAESRGCKAFNIARFVTNVISVISLTLALVLVTVFLMFSIVSTETVILIFTLCFVAAFSLVVRKTVFENENRVAVMFLVIALLGGIFLSYAMPPSTDYLWDSEIHYGRIIDLKDMLFNGERTFFDQQMEKKFIYTYRTFISATDDLVNTIMLDYATPSNEAAASVNLYQYIGYLPSAAIIAISQLLGMSALPMIVLAKFINVFIYAFVVYYGIKRLKSGQYLFSAIALIPSAMFLASGFTYDHIVTSFIMYAYACFISELQNPESKISSNTIFKMLSALFIGCGPKMVYFALGIPFLFIGKHKFNTNKEHRRYIIICLIVIAIIFMSFALPFFVDVEGNTDVRGGADVNSPEQLKFILSNPFKYVKILFNFLMDYISFAEMNDNIINFCFYGIPNSIFGTIAIMAIFYCIFTDAHTEKYPGRRKIRIITWLACLMEIALIATALYIAFTPVAHPTVNGCQYRYLFPVFAPFFYFLGTSKIRGYVNRKINNVFLFMILCANLFLSLFDAYGDLWLLYV